MDLELGLWDPVHAGGGEAVPVVVDQAGGPLPEPSVAEVLADAGHDTRGDGPDVGKGWEELAAGEVPVARELGQAGGRFQENFFRDALGPREHGGVPNRGEDVRVVGLRRVEGAARAGAEGREGAAAGEDDPAPGSRKGLLVGALGLAGGVGQGKNDGPVAVRGHGLDHLPGESARLRAHANQHGRPVRPDHGEEIGRKGNVVRECDLVVLELAQPGLADQPLRVHEEHPLPGFDKREPVPGSQGQRDELPAADARLARPVEQDALVSQRLPLEPEGGKNPGQGDGRGALDVVVEAAHLVPVFLEK
mmetsp:Transcript_2607/g.6558  ORF Transcript_2607/g.6558 Transcript_2607/m.6558 type:complete len:306 (-) Transcript_2607:981-1898(-)